MIFTQMQPPAHPHFFHMVHTLGLRLLDSFSLYSSIYVTSECKDLLRCLLRPNPSERIRMEDVMAHPWMNRETSLPFGPAPFPNRITSNDIADEVVEHMVNVLNVRL